MGNIVNELVKIHNENFKNKVGDKYFSEMMLGEQYEIYCLFNFTKENIFVEKLKKEDKNKKNSEIKNIHFSENKFLLEVNENNIKALKLYKKIGFEQISVRKNYYGNNEDAIIMMKII